MSRNLSELSYCSFDKCGWSTYTNVGSDYVTRERLRNLKLGHIPFYLNDERMRSKQALLHAMQSSKDEVFKVCANISSEEFEIGCRVWSFKSQAAFEKSPYCRK